jgi:hypothetical protein
MPDNNVTDPTIGSATQPVSTTPAIPVAPVIAPKKQPTAQEYLQKLAAEADNKPTSVAPNTTTQTPATNTPTQKLTSQQIITKYNSPYVTADRAQWGGYLDKQFPYSGTNVKQAVYSASNTSGIAPSLLYSSAMEEGMREGIDKPEKSSISYNQAATGKNAKFNPNEYPVDGFRTYGLDTFGDQAQKLIQKGYLPKDFAKNYTTFGAQNELNQNVNTAAFKTEDAALQAKAAVLRSTRDDLQDYAQKNNIQLTPKQLDFFNLAAYNGGEGTMQKMIQSYKAKGYLKDDTFLNDPKFTPSSYGSVYTNVQRRLANKQVMEDQGNFSDYKAPNQPQTSINNQNRKDYNDFVDSGSKNMAEYIKNNPKTTITPQMSGALQADLVAHKGHLQNLVTTGQAIYIPGVTHENVGQDTHKFSDAYMATTK